MNVIFEGTIEAVGTRADDTIKITVGTQELPPETMLRVFQFKGVHAHLLISKTKVSEGAEIALEDVKTVTEPVKGKSHSQRLRNAMYILFQQNGSKGDFNDFYSERMELLIRQVTDKLE